MEYICKRQTAHEIQFDVILFEEVEEVELDEMWSFVFSKENQRWLWLALDHQTGTILAYTFGKRKDEVFRTFQELLKPFSITMFYTDDWGSYSRNLPPDMHNVGKKNTQTIERKNLTLRTRIKRLCRKPSVSQSLFLCMMLLLVWSSIFLNLGSFILLTTSVMHDRICYI